ncbi:MAG: putative phospholipid ABC transporter permease protein MlaE [Myxococcota bacterium]|nr:putative phospholipid ABC transporter permease protein MlaE [Myxococcota bacterium]
MSEYLFSQIEGFNARMRYSLEYLGGVSELAGRTILRIFRPPFMIGDIIYQIEAIGMKSIAISVLTAIFSSLVMTIQFVVQLDRFGAKEYVANVVSLSLVRELGPVLVALMVGGRVGAGIAAEIGSMAVTEQVDALRALGADPIKKLVVPRVAATVIALPLLTTLADVLGIAGAMFIADLDAGVNATYFYNATLRAVNLPDFIGGLTKTVFFGFFMSVIACYQGLNTTGGTEGVGKSTTQTVVITSVVTLVSDFILTKILLEFGL